MMQANENDTEAFPSVSKVAGIEKPAGKAEEPAFEPVTIKPAPKKYKEPPNAFAQGLPGWSLEPPAVMVRR